MTLIFISGCIAFITSFVGLIPQIYKTLKTRSSKDLSMFMLINYCVCSFAWIIYGIETNSFVVTASNILGMLVSLGLIILKYRYDRLFVQA